MNPPPAPTSVPTAPDDQAEDDQQDIDRLQSCPPTSGYPGWSHGNFGLASVASAAGGALAPKSIEHGTAAVEQVRPASLSGAPHPGPSMSSVAIPVVAAGAKPLGVGLFDANQLTEDGPAQDRGGFVMVGVGAVARLRDKPIGDPEAQAVVRCDASGARRGR